MYKQYKQALFWKDLPSPKIKNNLGFLQGKKFESVLLKKNFPTFIYTGTGSIEQLDTFILQEKTIKKINKIGLDIYLYEPLTLRVQSEKHTNSYYSEFKNSDVTDVISEELESIDKFSTKFNLKNVSVYTCDYNVHLIQYRYKNLNLFCYDTFVRSAVDFYQIPNTKKIIIKRKFFCSNWRYSLHRHLIMCYLSHFDGNYSWYFNNISTDDITKSIWFNFKDLDFTIRDKLLVGYNKLNKENFYIDLEISKVTVNNVSNLNWPNDCSPDPFSNEFYLQCKESFCAIINETRFAYPFANFSEKTLVAINCKIPFILVAPPYTLMYLRELGFKTFNDFWDESYDNETDHQTRLLKIFKIIDYIDSISLSELTILQNSIAPILDHNVKILKQLKTNKQILL